MNDAGLRPPERVRTLLVHRYAPFRCAAQYLAPSYTERGPILMQPGHTRSVLVQQWDTYTFGARTRPVYINGARIRYVLKYLVYYAST